MDTEMNLTFLFTLGITGFVVAFLHATIPTHWLPFVAIGKACGWSTRQTVGAVAFAGGGHVLVTTGLGIGLAWFGWELSERFDHAFHWVTAGLLLTLGVWLVRRGFLASPSEGSNTLAEMKQAQGGDRLAVAGLFLTLTLTPCEVFLPVYLSAVPYGWAGILWLSVVLATATLGAMITLTWLTMRGAQMVSWRWLQRLDQRAIGGLLCLLGIMVAAVGH